MVPRTRQAFALWTQAQPAVSAFVFALVGDRGVRDEVLQDVALAIARNEVANARRRRGRFPAQLSDTAGHALAAAVAEVSDDERTALIRLIRMENLPQARGGPRTVEFDLVDEDPLGARFFEHKSHHDPSRTVIEED